MKDKSWLDQHRIGFRLMIIAIVLSVLWVLAVRVLEIEHGRMAPGEESAAEWIWEKDGSYARGPGKHIEAVWLDDSGITDKELRNLKGLSKLRRIDLSGTKITDKGLAELLIFPNLTNVAVTKTQVTLDGLIEFWNQKHELDKKGIPANGSDNTEPSAQ